MRKASNPEAWEPPQWFVPTAIAVGVLLVAARILLLVTSGTVALGLAVGSVVIAGIGVVALLVTKRAANGVSEDFLTWPER